MNEEEIIRKESFKFFDNKIKSSNKVNAIDDFHELKHRLNDFYTSENKAIFLDEIEFQIKKDLEEHRLEAHNGQSIPKCPKEIKAENLLFYIKQEIDTLPIIAHQKFKSNEHKIRDKVFVSYSHLDKEFLTDVQRHFKPFLSKIDFWDDSKIEPGQKWKEEIEKAILTTKVAILLVSTDFLGSDFIASNELPHLLSAAEKEGAVILIVILKPCLFEEFNELNVFQTMNPPNRPITKMNYDEKEELFVNLVRQTKKILHK
ncbi:MAG: hypothetical protein RLZZ175_1502 [Bacteroidota bacterium]|jgi:hypothetical protein